MSDNPDNKFFDRVGVLETDVSGIKAILSEVRASLQRLIDKGQTNWGTIATFIGVAMGIVIWVSALSREPMKEQLAKLELEVANLRIELKQELKDHELTDGHQSVVKSVSELLAKLQSHIEMDQQRHDDLVARTGALEMTMQDTAKSRFTKSDGLLQGEKHEKLLDMVIAIRERLSRLEVSAK